MLALVLVAVSLGLSNFAAAVGIGVSGVDARTRLRVGVIFGLFETGMPSSACCRSLPAKRRSEGPARSQWRGQAKPSPTAAARTR